MTLSAAREACEELLFKRTTPEEFQRGLEDLIENKKTGRASGYYNPGADPCAEENPLWP